jgi:acylglycerol lipase
MGTDSTLQIGGEAAESRFVRASDGLELHILQWISVPARPWAILIFLHGIASHAGWFGETAADLKNQGVGVYAPDRRGSGRSGGPRGHLRRYERAVADLDETMTIVASENMGVPVFLAASSWAAKLGLVYAALRPSRLAGLMLLGPGLLPRVNLSTARRVEVVIAHFVAPTARIAIPLTPEQYTPTSQYVDLIRMDPLRLLTATTQFFWETARLDRRRRSASVTLNLPLLVLQGDHDAMIDVPKTIRWFSQLPIEDKKYIAYAGAGHTLDFEPDRAKYVIDILNWLSDRAPTRFPRSMGRP